MTFQLLPSLNMRKILFYFLSVQITLYTNKCYRCKKASVTHLSASCRIFWSFFQCLLTPEYGEDVLCLCGGLQLPGRDVLHLHLAALHHHQQQQGRGQTRPLHLTHNLPDPCSRGQSMYINLCLHCSSRKMQYFDVKKLSYILMSTVSIVQWYQSHTDLSIWMVPFMYFFNESVTRTALLAQSHYKCTHCILSC
jgi:hypothetical protein